MDIRLRNILKATNIWCSTRHHVQHYTNLALSTVKYMKLLGNSNPLSTNSYYIDWLFFLLPSMVFQESLYPIPPGCPQENAMAHHPLDHRHIFLL